MQLNLAKRVVRENKLKEEELVQLDNALTKDGQTGTDRILDALFTGVQNPVMREASRKGVQVKLTPLELCCLHCF